MEEDIRVIRLHRSVMPELVEAENRAHMNICHGNNDKNSDKLATLHVGKQVVEK